MKYAYEINHFSYKYPLSKSFSLKNINLKIQKDKIYGILGSSNSGKTSLCLSLKGYIPHFYKGEFAGEINVNHTNLLHENTSQNIGIVLHNSFSQLTKIKKTVFEEIAFGLENMGYPTNIINKKVIHAIKNVNLENHILDNPLNLSGGQIQRTVIASIMVLEPEILILDEPTAQLDPKEAENIYKILLEYKNLGHTIIIVDSNIDLLYEYSDRFILLQNGLLIKEGTHKDIFLNKSIHLTSIEIPTTVFLIKELEKQGLKIPTNIIKEADLIKFLDKRINYEQP